jgi:hypothetical protein
MLSSDRKKYDVWGVVIDMVYSLLFHYDVNDLQQDIKVVE